MSYLSFCAKNSQNFVKVQISLRFDEFFHRKQGVAKGDF